MKSELEKLSLPELLDRLSDVTNPEPVSYLPQTDTWWILSGLVFIVSLFLGWRFYNRWRLDAYRREALAALGVLEPLMRQDDTAFERGIAQLLRRTALASSPRAEVASLHGAAWVGFLDLQIDGAGFTEGAGRALLTEPYRAKTSQSIDERTDLLNLARGWIETHRSNIT